MWKTSPLRYGRVARWLHWTSALLILFALATGKVTEFLGLEGTHVLRAHVIVDGAIALLTAARLVLWLTVDTRPPPDGEIPAVQKAVARFVHIALYLALLVLIGSGAGMMILTGAPDVLFFASGGALPDFQQLPPRQAHELAGTVLIGLLVAHIGAALYHHFVLRDETLRRMM